MSYIIYTKIIQFIIINNNHKLYSLQANPNVIKKPETIMQKGTMSLND